MMSCMSPVLRNVKSSFGNGKVRILLEEFEIFWFDMLDLQLSTAQQKAQAPDRSALGPGTEKLDRY